MAPHPLCLALAVFTLFAFAAHASAADVRTLRADVCIVGGGSAGIGAAIAASRAGADVILVERQGSLGGTSTNAYVSNWEPGPGDSLAREIYERLRAQSAVAIVSDHNRGRKLGHFGLWLPTADATYEQTLRRARNPRHRWRAMVFEPSVFSKTVAHLLAETGKSRVMLDTTFADTTTDVRRVVSVEARSSSSVFRIEAEVFIDSTGGAHLCRNVGCETMVGPESRGRFDEPSAPTKPGRALNGISLCYRVRRSKAPTRQEAPVPAAPFPRVAHVQGMPNGDRIVNPLAMLPGRALIEMGYDAALAECQRRVQAHWHWLQSYPTFSEFELDSIAPMLGIRESYRVVGEYVLTQHDLLAGLVQQKHVDVIAIADHSMDLHGASRGIGGELRGPYGIPYRCLIPKGWANLLVACRGASFSHIAASSCRLNRTMIAIGRAAGLAAAMAAERGADVASVDAAELRKQLGM